MYFCPVSIDFSLKSMAIQGFDLSRFLFAILFGSCSLFFTGCGKTTKSTVIPEDKMVEILGELFTAEAYISAHFREYQGSPDSGKVFTKRIIRQFGYGVAEYDSTMYFYAGNTRRFEKVLEKTMAALYQKELLAAREDSLSRVAGMQKVLPEQDSIRYADSIQRADFLPRGEGRSRLAVPQVYSAERRAVEIHRRFITEWFNTLHKPTLYP